MDIIQDIMQNESYKVDEYESNFLISKDNLIKCQISKDLSSCMQCDNILSCSVRESYVMSVYKNMNKGQSGSFDFN